MDPWISVCFSRHTTVGRRRLAYIFIRVRLVPVVEGMNNKARGDYQGYRATPKSAKSLWDRLILDLNRASQAIGYSIEHIRQMAKGLTALFDGPLHLKNGISLDFGELGCNRFWDARVNQFPPRQEAEQHELRRPPPARAASVPRVGAPSRTSDTPAAARLEK